MAAPTVSSTTVCSASTSVTIATGEALVWIGGNHQGDVTGVTYNGTAMTEVCAANTAFNENVHIFYMASPTVGTANCIPTFSGGSGNRGDAVVIAGQKTSGQPISFNTNGSATEILQTSPSDKTLYIAGSYGESDLTLVAGPTLIDDYLGASYQAFNCAYQATDTSIGFFDWTQASGQRNAVASIAIQGSDATNFTIQYDNATNGGETSSATSKTTSHTCGTLTNGIIVAHIGLRDASTTDQTVSGVTYAGAAMTKLRSDFFNTSEYSREEIWYKVAPSSGANNVIVTMGGTTSRINLIVSSWQGVDQTTPFETNNGSGTITTSATSSTISVTPTSNNSVIIDSCYMKDDESNSIGSNQVLLSNAYAGSTDRFGASWKRLAVAAATNMVHSWSNSDHYAHGVGVLKPVSAGGGGTTFAGYYGGAGWY